MWVDDEILFHKLRISASSFSFSEICAHLVRRFPKLASRCVSIPFNAPTLVTDDQGNRVEVTLLDANHCPGTENGRHQKRYA
jgi:hypothetical protein